MREGLVHVSIILQGRVSKHCPVTTSTYNFFLGNFLEFASYYESSLWWEQKETIYKQQATSTGSMMHNSRVDVVAKFGSRERRTLEG
jgi:hypothetical protein